MTPSPRAMSAAPTPGASPPPGATHGTEPPRRWLADLVFTAVVVVVLAAIGGALAARGAGYYELSLFDRVEHEDYRVFSPGGSVGHMYGIVGTALVLTNLLYLLRRRFASWRLGTLRAWLHIHVLTGLVGALLVLFHSAFQLRAPLAIVNAVALLVVVVTGILGRFMHAAVRAMGLGNAIEDWMARAADLVRHDDAGTTRAAKALRFFRVWRGLHRFSALVMVLCTVIHVVVAFYFGYHAGGGE